MSSLSIDTGLSEVIYVTCVVGYLANYLFLCVLHHERGEGRRPLTCEAEPYLTKLTSFAITVISYYTLVLFIT